MFQTAFTAINVVNILCKRHIHCFCEKKLYQCFEVPQILFVPMDPCCCWIRDAQLLGQKKQKKNKQKNPQYMMEILVYVTTGDTVRPNLNACSSRWTGDQATHPANINQRKISANGKLKDEGMQHKDKLPLPPFCSSGWSAFCRQKRGAFHTCFKNQDQLQCSMTCCCLEVSIFGVTVSHYCM